MTSKQICCGVTAACNCSYRLKIDDFNSVVTVQCLICWTINLGSTLIDPEEICSALLWIIFAEFAFWNRSRNYEIFLPNSHFERSTYVKLSRIGTMKRSSLDLRCRWNRLVSCVNLRSCSKDVSIFPNLFVSVQFQSASPPRILIGEDETEDEKERTAKKMESYEFRIVFQGQLVSSNIQSAPKEI